MSDLVRLGYAVSLQMEDGAIENVRGSLLYDPSGSSWPKCSVLIMGFARGGRVAEKPTKFARDWIGREPREGRVTLPPREISAWDSIGRATRIYYTMNAAEPEDLEHPFGGLGGIFGRLIPFTFAKDYPSLYRRTGAARLELGSGCSVLPGMGFVSP